RGLLTGTTGVAGDTTTGQILWVIASCVVLVGVFFPLATWAYRRKI
ncbi:MAG: oleandomycin transport system permease protein, partial [Subtercola sp.]|nr:oleandomycin transport system permease protein [Subtercola sp.]